MSALDDLQNRRAAVAKAERAITRLEAEQSRASGAVDRALEPLRAYHEAVGAGERDADPVIERQLTEKAQEEQSALTMRPAVGSHGSRLVMDAVDERVESQLQGARRALERERRQLDAFIVRRRADLIAELPEMALAARDVVDEKRRAYLAAVDEWKSVAVLWHPLIAAWHISKDDLTTNPLQLGERESVWPPMPQSLMSDDEIQRASSPMARLRAAKR
jgi:hypothetical protein